MSLVKVMRSDSDIQNVFSTLAGFVKQFQANPYVFLYESDLQGILFSKLLEGDSALLDLQTSDAFRRQFNNDRTKITTSVWKTEYPSGIRYDIAAIDRERCGSDRYPWNQPVSIAMEIKYWWDGNVATPNSVLESDIQKLERGFRENVISRAGIAVLFLQIEADHEAFSDGCTSWNDLKQVSGVTEVVVSPSRVAWRSRVIAEHSTA